MMYFPSLELTDKKFILKQKLNSKIYLAVKLKVAITR